MIHFRTCSQTRDLIVLCLLTLLLTLTQTPAIVAQGMFLHPVGPIAQFASPGIAPDDLSQPPPGVTRIGGTEIVLVKFRGIALFKIASPSVLERKNPGGQIPVEVRARRIEENLDYIVALNLPLTQRDSYLTTYDPATLEIKVSTLNKQTILTATDAHRTEPQIIMTVTEQDAEYNGLSRHVG